tara:strand:- start:3997 stop:4557 length:561 start_codon:yes stop_codon:yes gene_type:complete
MKLSSEDESALIKLSEDKKIFLEGNILKVLTSDNYQFLEYLDFSERKDKDNRRKRLEVTKQVQAQNRELAIKAKENDELMKEIKEALKNAEDSKENALNDLDLIQKKRQFELIDNIVNVSLYIIIGVGITSTLLYGIALFNQSIDTALLGNTWSNLLGILLTNSFSIIGTIMGVKYASESNNVPES